MAKFRTLKKIVLLFLCCRCPNHVKLLRDVLSNSWGVRARNHETIRR